MTYYRIQAAIKRAVRNAVASVEGPAERSAEGADA
jgi:hypothetical protein